MADRAVWPFTWCEVHFAGAVEKMAGCLIWRERGLSGEPDCVLVQRLLVDRDAIDYEAAAGEYLFATDPVPPRTWDMLPFLQQQTKLAVARAIVDVALREA